MELKCKICDSNFNSKIGLTNHIRLSHKLTCQQYYDAYYKKEGDGICSNCSKPTKFKNIEEGYSKVCCIKCAMPSRAKRNLEKYGYTSNFSNPAINSLSHSKKANVKRENTMLERYGAKSYLATDKVKQQTIKYNQTHFGVDYYTQTEEYKQKSKQTCMNHFGVENILQLPEVIEKSKIASHTEEANLKRKQTTLNRIGVDNSFKLPEVQAKAQANSHTPEAYKKRTASRKSHINEITYKAEQTKRKNGHKSSYEILFEKLCIKNNIDFKDNYYKDSRYPYLCDYYLPKYDLFVEIFGGWFHNSHIFGTDHNDEEILSKWKKKSQTIPKYAEAINIWSVRDLEKVKCAKENKLNFIILWTIPDIKKFFTESIYKNNNIML